MQAAAVPAAVSKQDLSRQAAAVPAVAVSKQTLSRHAAVPAVALCKQNLSRQAAVAPAAAAPVHAKRTRNEPALPLPAVVSAQAQQGVSLAQHKVVCFLAAVAATVEI